MGRKFWCQECKIWTSFPERHVHMDSNATKTIKIHLSHTQVSWLTELNKLRAQSSSETIGELIKEAYEKYVPTLEHPNGWVLVEMRRR